MYDHIVAQLAIELEQFIVEVQVSSRRTGGPLPAHWSDIDCGHISIKFKRPLLNACLELLFVTPASLFHGLELFLSRVNRASTVAVTFSISSSSLSNAKV